MNFFATCPKGFESLLADELIWLGLSSVRRLKGQVSFEGPIEDAYQACLWSRLASRVILVLDRVEANDSDSLYESVFNIPWEDHIPQASTIAVDANGTNQNLRNTQFIAMRTKDAIADRLQQKCGWRVQVDVSHPDLRIVTRLNKDRATIGIDLSGEALFRRGWELGRNRVKNLIPLRADFAAVILASCGWFRNCRHDDPSIIIPFAGAGSLLCEATSQAQDIAPGLMRPRWGFEAWGNHAICLWNEMYEHAQQRAEAKKDAPIHIIASDIRPHFDTYCKQALRGAGLQAEALYITDTQKPNAFDSAINTLPNTPACAINLSWVGPQDAAIEAKALGMVAKVQESLPDQTSIAACVCNDIIDSYLGQTDSEPTDILVGSAPATIRHYTNEKDKASALINLELKDQKTVPVLMTTSDQFAARLYKVAKQRRKWANKEYIDCYRVYDQDLPDYAFAIDIYHGSMTPGTWAVIQEYAAPKEIDPTTAKKRLLDCLSLVPPILGVQPQNTFLRVRERAKGGSQYALGTAAAPKTPQSKPHPRRHKEPILPAGSKLVDEGGLTFEVNFEGRLDTGLFLDHRETRSMLREMMKQTKGSKRFLNVFAYTGSATCYAADGGAKYTTTVDLSGPYLSWARRNMERNGFEGPEHEYIQADVLRWVFEQRHSKNRWDLIFCDPPTFSNSSSMGRKTFDVQRDHAELLIDISRLLTREGVCVFSCNLRNFKPDTETLAKAGVAIEDITASTIPEDFKRNPKIHHCYLVRRVR